LLIPILDNAFLAVATWVLPKAKNGAVDGQTVSYKIVNHWFGDCVDLQFGVIWQV